MYAKNSLKYVPLVGTTWWFTESIFLKRNYDSDKRTMERSHAALQVSRALAAKEILGFAWQSFRFGMHSRYRTTCVKPIYVTVPQKAALADWKKFIRFG